MYLYRYMSKKEFDAMMAFLPVNHSKQAFTARTNSCGFCFLPEITIWTDNENNKFEYTAEKCYSFLSGIVSNEILVKFELSNETFNKFHTGYGVYCNPMYWDETIDITEYSICSYNRNELIPVAYSFPEEFIWYNI